MRRPALALALTLACLRHSAAAATPPFVGCASDGQSGPVAAPSGRAPDLPIAPDVAARLAWYEADASGAVLGPAGWHCIKLYGSGGWTLVVTPAAHDMASLAGRIAGPVVQLTRVSGENSGRFTVASLADGLFPEAAGFVRQVRGEGFPPGFVTRQLAATDQTSRHGTGIVLYETPSGAQGLGTAIGLAPGDGPIQGAVILLPAGDTPDMLHLAIRLPAPLADLAPAIAGDAAGRSNALRRP